MKQTNKKIKALFILVDGIGDLGIKDQQFQTPLQLAKIPYIDAISDTGISGVMDPVEPGLACGSDTAHMSIFGYDPFTLYRGRGAFETIGSGIPMDTNEIAFKCNFAHMDPITRIVLKRRVDREFQLWGLPLIDLINGMKLSVYSENDTIITAKHATEHRIGLKITSTYASDSITGTDPLKNNLPLQKAKSLNMNDENSIKSAHIVNLFSDMVHQVLTLKEWVTNCKYCVTEGMWIETKYLSLSYSIGVRPFKELFGFDGFMIAPTAIINGIGQTIGLDILDVAGATGDYHTNLDNKGLAAIKHLRETDKDFCFLHIKAVDDAGHDQSLEKKIEFLEKSDKMLQLIVQKHLEQNDDFELVIILTGDHTTPISVGDHTYQTVPLAISTISAIQNKFYGKDVQKELLYLCDNNDKFDEISCSTGILGRFCGGQVIITLKKFIKQIELIYNN